MNELVERDMINSSTNTHLSVESVVAVSAPLTIVFEDIQHASHLRITRVLALGARDKRKERGHLGEDEHTRPLLLQLGQ